MLRKLIILVFVLIPTISLSQEKITEEKNEKSVKEISTTIPVLSQYSNNFRLTKAHFNKRTDYNGRGEILEVELEIVNNTDDPLDLYIYVIATYEKQKKPVSSFEIPLPPEKKIKSFVPYPYDIKNFIYPEYNEDGTVKKDRKGKDKFKFEKFPKDPKMGFNPETGKAYHIVEKKFIRTEHLSKYRSNYFFFNWVTIIVFDEKGKPVFKQNYYLRGWRR